MHRTHTQAEWIARAQAVLPGGGFGNFDPNIIVRAGRGSRVLDEDGREYVDYLIGSGPMLLGHNHPEVTEAVMQQLSKGTTFFANNAAAVELAEEICRAVPCADSLRYTASGGEADMYAIRLARAFTGRERIVKFEGGFHGMSAEALMSLAPGMRVNFPQAVPDTAGVPESVRAEVLIAPFNDAAFARSLIAEHADQIAAIIVEPLQRVVPPVPGFLQALREEADRHGIVLIFDEVVTGFRLAYGGAQEIHGVVPDLCTLGKIIGGGFALAAIAGRRDIMALFDKAAAPEGRFLPQLGTLSGNPVAAVAGLRTLEILRREGQYARLRTIGQRLMDMQGKALGAAGIPHRVVGDPVLFDIVFTDRKVDDYRDWATHDAALNTAWNRVLREQGILKSPAKLYPSLAVTEEDIALTAKAVAVAVATVSRLFS